MHSLWPTALILYVLCGSSSAATLVYRDLPEGPAEFRGEHQPAPHLAIYGTNGLTLSLEMDGAFEWRKGHLTAFEISPRGYRWIVRNDRIQMAGVGTGGNLVDRTHHFERYRNNGRLFASRMGDIWLSGSRKMMRRDGLFAPSGFNPDDELQIEPRCDDPFGNTWAALIDKAGKHKGVAASPFANRRQWNRVKLPDPFPDDWKGMCVDDVGFVWIATPESVAQLDPRTEGAFIQEIRRPGRSPITAITPIANRQILVGFANGDVVELSTRPKQKPTFKLITRLNAPIRAMMESNTGMLWLVAGTSLYRTKITRQPWQKAWTELPRMPAGNHDNIFAALDGILYSAGGKTYFGWPASKWVNLDHTWSYHRDQTTWKREPPMLEPGKAYSGIAPLHKSIWLIGGLFRAGNGTKATDTVEIYHPDRRTYEPGPRYPAPRGQVVALNHNDRIYAIGGADKIASSEMFSIGIGETKWRKEPNAPGPVTQAAGCVIGNKLYVAAGRRSNCPGLFVFNVRARQWFSVKHPAEIPPAAPLVTAWRDEVWIMGGRGKSGGEVAIYGYETSTGKWKQGPDLPLPLSWGAATSNHRGILIAGGAYRDEAVGNYFNSDRTFFWNKLGR